MRRAKKQTGPSAEEKAKKAEYKRNWMRNWRKNNREKHNADNRVRSRATPAYNRKKAASWRKKNPAKTRVAMAAYHASHKDLINERHRATYLVRAYGITVADYDRMLVEQGGVCAICCKPEASVDPKTGLIRRLAVDHHEATKTARALLCGRCNLGIGYFMEDPARCRAAADYIEKHAAKRPKR